jgi:predicted nucleic acid-binding protein
MSCLVFLDAVPLGMVSNPKNTPACQACKGWLNTLSSRGYIAVIPEIADYEVRRELLRAGLSRSVRRLDQLKSVLPYLPLTTEVMLNAAELWAEARRSGYPTADPKALDGDVILAAQAILAASEGNEVIIATTNVGHLSRFVEARDWSLI